MCPGELWYPHPVRGWLMKVEPPNPHFDEVVRYAFPGVEECLDLLHIDGGGPLWQRDRGYKPVGVEALEVLLKVAHQAVCRGVLDDIIDSLPLRRGEGAVVPRLRRSWGWWWHGRLVLGCGAGRLGGFAGVVTLRSAGCR